MNEEDTFKRLQGMTRQQAEEIHLEVFNELIMELSYENVPDTNPQSSTLPTHILRERVNKKLMPYGWSFDKIFELNIDNIS